MTITITIDGVEREYQGDYNDLHNKDWGGIVRDFIDDMEEANDKPL